MNPNYFNTNLFELWANISQYKTTQSADFAQFLNLGKEQFLKILEHRIPTLIDQ